MLRRAAEGDFPAIHRLIDKVQINPSELDWHRFIGAYDASGKLLGCGQLKPHGPAIVELASIAVEPEARHQGIASAIIEFLLKESPRPVYLVCMPEMGSFYEKWGFRALERGAVPPYYRRLLKLAAVYFKVEPDELGMLVMKLA